MSWFQGHAHSLFLPYTKTNQICGLGNQELDPKLAYNLELANSALHLSCLVGKKKTILNTLWQKLELELEQEQACYLELEYLDHNWKN
jgi:hypothetical protein